MNHDAERSGPQPRGNTVVMVHLAILLSLPIYVLVLWVVNQTGQLEPMPPEIFDQILLPGIVVAVAFFAASFIIPGFLVQRLRSRRTPETGDTTQRPGALFILQTILTDALIETGVLVALVLGLLGGGLTVLLPFAVVGVALMIYQWPSQRAFQKMEE